MSSFDKTTSNTTTIPFHNNITHKRRSKTPSFSSVLLDAIYHSIDDTETDTNSSPSQHNYTPKTSTTTTTNNKLSNSFENGFDYDYIQPSKQKRNKMRSDGSSLETIDLRHAIMIDSWIENQPPQPQPQQQSQAYYYRHNDDDHNNIKFIRQKSISNKSRNTTSSSSTSSSSSSSCFTQQRIESCLRLNHTRKHESSSKIFNKTKLKALKIYSDLKKSKQRQQQQQSPVSPGARIAAFLNSIFKNSENNTQSKNKMSTTNATSECSSASSFTRSCLSKTTISTEKSNRSVRFYPLNTIIFDDEYSSACSHKSIRTNHNQHEVDHQKLLDLSNAAINHQRQRNMLVDENYRTCSDKLIPTKRIQVNVDDQNLPDSSKAAFNHLQQRTIIVDEHLTTHKLIRNVDDQKLYNSSKEGFEHQQQQQCRKLKREKEIDALMMMVIKRDARKSSDDDYEEILSIEMSLDEELMNVDDDNNDDDNDNEDGESCDSSDLFELENLSSIGVGAFTQELPVFGTTSLKNLTS